jgi:phosphoglycolate phosphatase
MTDAAAEPPPSRAAARSALRSRSGVESAYVKLVIFDCDGTLVDSQHAICAAMEEAFRGAGLAPPPRAAVLDVVGLSLTTAVARLLGKSPHARDVVDLAEAYKASFAERRRRPDHDEPLYPGVRDTLLRLAARPSVVLGIATGKSRRGIDAALAREGLAPLFTTIQTADAHPSKPDPSMVRAAMAEVGAAPAGTVMIGDTTFDIEMGRAAGARALGVAWGYHPAEALAAAGAADVAQDCAHLARALDDLLFNLESVP